MAESLRQHRVAQINDNGIELVRYPPIGKQWYKRFKARHPIIDTVVSKSIEISRLKDSSKEVLQAWFDAFQLTVEKYDIKPENIYNMDESGFSIRSINASRVIINKEVRQRYQANPGRQEWVTAVECICMDGTSISPLIIFKGESLSNTWVPADIADDWRFSTNSRGWTNDLHGLMWLHRCFELHT